MEEALKTIAQQVHVMRRLWPQFEVVHRGAGFAMWQGPLVGVERPYLVSIAYALPEPQNAASMLWSFPIVQVRSPALRPNFDAEEEAPLPHVFLDKDDLPRSPLCLFDIDAEEWSSDDFIAHTTVPWAAEWLACYEGWLATGRWYGGGRHAGMSIDAAAER